ncbi:MAG: YciI family protein [Pseudomonadota bacterium]
MIYIITCLDKPDALPRRLQNIDAHRNYLATHTHPVKTLLSGPLVREDGETMKGSHFLVDAESRAAIEAWQADDPLANADVWDSVIIEAFLKRVDNLSPAEATS